MKFMPLTAKSRLRNRFVLVLDSSGSMEPLRSHAVEAFNSIIGSIKQAGAESGQQNSITICTFNSYEGTRFPALNKAAGEIAPLGMNDYRPVGGTPLFDAVCEAINKMHEVNRTEGDSEETSFVINVITDGQDTGSPKYGSHGMMRMIREMEKNGRWTFAFMVPKGQGRWFSSTHGIPEGNISEWEVGTVEGIRSTASAYAAATMSFSNARSAGAKASTSYFTPDLSKLKTSQVKQLDDLSNRIRVHEVKEESRIDEFVKKKNKGLYAIGSGYYQLMKKEKVQNHKQILIREKGKQAIYGGPEARKLLGLPDYELTITPGNHANYDVFVQSKSPNRRLPRGTFCAIDHQQKVGELPTWGTP